MTDKKKNPTDPIDETDLTEPIDPFDPAALRLPQDFTETAKVKKLLETIPVEKFIAGLFPHSP